MMKKAKLDPTKLYGFRIVASERQSATGAPITIKIGGKDGFKTGSKLGLKGGEKSGAPV